MPTRRMRGPDGEDHEVTELSFQNAREHWNEYLLDDGTVLKLKPVATQVFRFEDLRDGDGNPMYIIKSTNVTVVSVPETLRKKED
jgi:hypothetical protein